MYTLMWMEANCPMCLFEREKGFLISIVCHIFATSAICRRCYFAERKDCWRSYLDHKYGSLFFCIQFIQWFSKDATWGNIIKYLLLLNRLVLCDLFHIAVRVLIMCCFLFHSQNSANRGEELISSKGLQTEIANPTLTSFPIAWTNATNEINLENTAAGKVSNNVDTLSSRNEGDEQNVVCASLLEDSKNVRLQEAATKAQAAFRGYMVIFYIDTFIS